MLDNVKKSVFWSSCPSQNSTPQTERQLTDRIRLSNLRQILNFSIMMILVQAVNVSIFCMIHARTRQFGLYMAVIALFVFVMAGNIFLTEYMFRALTKGAGTTRLKYHTYAFTAVMALFCLSMTFLNLRERITMENYLLFMLYIAACPLLTLRELVATISLTASVAFCLFSLRQAPPMIYSHMALFCCAAVFLSRSRYHSITGSLRELYQANETNLCLMNQAHHDSLTRLLNRCGFAQKLEELLPITIRMEIPIAVIMVDIDYFKRFNDANGHCEGDLCLQQIASALAGGIHRSSDLICRYGGEEFQILLYGIDHANAVKAAERLRRLVECLEIPAPDHSVSPHMTISLGLASGVLRHERDFDALVRLSDQQLYHSKETGKNKVSACRLCGSAPGECPFGTDFQDFPVTAAEHGTNISFAGSDSGIRSIGSSLPAHFPPS
ncbi:GGDEF domain-containing protein [Enterocloster lavalensis]|uniref:GGDEF domain-containing protein n=1 Tax=Enterocloster lavalensis TaxID=460384 RepID=UPI0023F2FBC5|nr:GGDEF domain-containing protein [Enterocloster lavalensis]